MGSSIKCIIPKEKEYSLEVTKQKLNDVFKSLKAEFLHLEEYGNFTNNTIGNWSLILIPAELNQPEYITGENNGCDIYIYKKVVLIGYTERFSGLYFQEKAISEQLIKIITQIAKEFSDSDKIIIASGGMDETDHVIDMAYYENADFDQICNKMIELNGMPAKELNELYDKSWYLK